MQLNSYALMFGGLKHYKEVKMLYVTMTDKFLSGWGMAKNQINKLIFECENEEEARIVFDNANSRTDQKYINICHTRPYYDKNRYYVQTKDKNMYPCWYKKDYFINKG